MNKYKFYYNETGPLRLSLPPRPPIVLFASQGSWGEENSKGLPRADNLAINSIHFIGIPIQGKRERNYQVL